MKISGSVALVTGANQGPGRAYARLEVFADDRSQFVKASLSRDHALIYPPIQQFWDAAVSGTP